MKYRFITFEGVEGCGKSTQTKLLGQYLQQKNIENILTREPGGSKAAEEIREILISGDVGKLDGVSEILLNFAARRNHVEKLIKPALQENKVVICDRFFDSTFAYQGYGYGCDINLIRQVQKIAIENFKPDITFLIDIDVKITLGRVKNRISNNRYEKMDIAFHQRVKDGFLELSKQDPDRFRIIDGRKSIKQIHQEIISNF